MIVPHLKTLRKHCDYEKSTIKALRSVFPEITINGYYHFQESLVRKAKSSKKINTKEKLSLFFLCRSLGLFVTSQVGNTLSSSRSSTRIYNPFSGTVKLTPSAYFIRCVW